jgi:hypothetical protein
MNEQQVAEGVKEWAEVILPELLGSRSFLSAQRGELPDVQVDVIFKRIAPSDSRFPFSELQQRLLRVFDVDLHFMVDHVGGDADADRGETEQVRDFGARLEASVLQDATLGGRVFMASPIMQFDYTVPFVEYPDGTRGRQMKMSLIVGELADEGDSF